MIQKETRLVVADNTGAKVLQCIHIVGGTRKRFAYLGHVIKCSVKKSIPGATVKKGEVVTAVLVRTRKEHRRKDGSYIRFSDNAAVIIKDNVPIATRVFGPVARPELRAKFPKIVSMAPEAL